MNFIRSVHLTAGLIFYMIIFIIIGSLIPQNQSMQFYHENYNSIFGKIILILSINNYPHSIFFLIPVTIFLINLISCSLHRILSRLKNKAALRIGPDIIHAGIILLIIASFLTLTLRDEEIILLKPGDKINILKNYELIYDDFVYETYDNGSAKRYASKITLIKNGKFEKKIDIEINNPLKVEGYTIYQNAFSIYRESEKEKAGESVKYLSEIKIVYDPGFYFVIISFIVFCVGLLLTIYQKIGDIKK